MKSMICTVAMAMVFGMLSGCASYYRVTDPTTGAVYYSDRVDRTNTGAAQFKDAGTGNQITLQNSEVANVSKEEFETNRKGKHIVAPQTTSPAK